MHIQLQTVAAARPAAAINGQYCIPNLPRRDTCPRGPGPTGFLRGGAGRLARPALHWQSGACCSCPGAWAGPCINPSAAQPEQQRRCCHTLARTSTGSWGATCTPLGGNTKGMQDAHQRYRLGEKRQLPAPSGAHAASSAAHVAVHTSAARTPRCLVTKHRYACHGAQRCRIASATSVCSALLSRQRPLPRCPCDTITQPGWHKP